MTSNLKGETLVGIIIEKKKAIISCVENIVAISVARHLLELRLDGISIEDSKRNPQCVYRS